MRSALLTTIIAALFLISGWAGEASALETRGLKLVRVTQRDGKAVELYKGSHALLIGVSDYTAGWPDLESIPGELKRLEKALQSQGFNVERVMNPDGDALEQAFENFIDKYGLEPENRLLFFYSGHGYTRKIGRRQKGYLVPADAPNPNKDERGFVRRSLTMSKVQTWAREIEAKHALFLFDSCFSGTIFKTRALPTPRHITDKTSRPVRQFITAGSAGQEVPARSVFLPSFIRAIKGEGDTNKDGYVTGTELGQYLHEKVMGYDQGQTPQFGKIKDPELDEGDFVFVPANKTDRSVAAAPKSSAPPITINAEEEFWNAVRNSTDPEDLKTFLGEFPNGRFTTLARLKLKKLERRGKAAPPIDAKSAVTLPGARSKSRSAAGAWLRLAVFPELFGPQLADLLGLTEKMAAEQINKVILDGSGGGVSVVFTYTEKPYAEQDAWRDRAWKGFFFKKPETDFVLTAAKGLDVDAVLLYKVDRQADNNKINAEYELYLVDMRGVRSEPYGVIGSGNISGGSENWLDKIKATARELFDAYRRDSHRRK